MRPDSSDLATYLMNTDAPGYFDKTGFIQGGTAPSAQYDEIENRINSLTPYNPSDISALELRFLE